MASRRPYREALGIEKACDELKSGCNSKYDSELVGTAFSLIEQNNGKVFWINS
jgi:HD-GYP domain-containing protein (c-di-GMP phosphodiesterase class II)